MKKERDITVVRIDNKRSLVIACDVSGGIGPKAGDSLSVSGEKIGYFTARVALMEIMAVGVTPITVVDTLSVEYEPTGKEIIEGIKKVVTEIGLDFETVINGSTEDNIMTFETGVGVTAIGLAEKGSLRMSCSHKGDLLAVIGIPLVGEEMLEKKDMAVSIDDLKNLLKKNYIREIIPVGSKGIGYEADLLASMSDLKVDFSDGLNFDLKKSAGPSSVFLLSISPDKLLNLREDICHKPIEVLGRLI